MNIAYYLYAAMLMYRYRSSGETPVLPSTYPLSIMRYFCRNNQRAQEWRTILLPWNFKSENIQHCLHPSLYLSLHFSQKDVSVSMAASTAALLQSIPRFATHFETVEGHGTTTDQLSPEYPPLTEFLKVDPFEVASGRQLIGAASCFSDGGNKGCCGSANKTKSCC